MVGCSQSERGSDQPGGSAVVDGGPEIPSQVVTEPTPIKVLYPFDGALFPPEIAAPTFRWKDDNPECDAWRIEFRFQEGQPIDFRSGVQEWTPSGEIWETVKRRSRESDASVTLLGLSKRKVLSKASLFIRTSQDEVGAPIFYREVNLPFRDAVKDPSRIRWRRSCRSAATATRFPRTGRSSGWTSTTPTTRGRTPSPTWPKR